MVHIAAHGRKFCGRMPENGARCVAPRPSRQWPKMTDERNIMASEEKPNTRTSCRRVYKMEVDCGRMGVVEATFTAHPEDVQAITGQEINYGEILGKHSEIFVVIDEDTLSEIDAPPVVLGWLEEHLGHHVRHDWAPFDSWTISGYNPLEYADEEWLDGFLKGAVNAETRVSP